MKRIFNILLLACALILVYIAVSRGQQPLPQPADRIGPHQVVPGSLEDQRYRFGQEGPRRNRGSTSGSLEDQSYRFDLFQPSTQGDATQQWWDQQTGDMFK